ncbi:Retrovirus-related Pol polyprotein from transposon TNT 1-94 [Vitis vinifera]|uniref:Retrovirus-related Pol polyprotein from transposon TNT 1-94 n=1 Tax=Vitis vinifera TaxID=29760 RepID=A0A438FG07_VITVI|nr:Retrovirus-related Pol polyprotein from transposon TNT 1-94 [Vitis vinifera]
MDSHGQKYFISFIDDLSRYMYLYILHNKNEALEAFKVFKVEVEKQNGKQIKIVISDRGGEYYGRYLEDGQSPRPFVKFLQEHEIVAQYTMPGSPDQNALKTAVYILNRVPTKGCSSEVRIYNPQEKKLDPRTISGYFIGYAEKSKGSVGAINSETWFLILILQTLNLPLQFPQAVDNIPVDQVDQEFPDTSEQQVEPHTSLEDIGATLRRSTRTKRIRIVYNAMKDEMSSMKCNDVWDLVELPNGAKTIGCKWVFKTKKDSLGNIERYKARLVAKAFTHKEGIDYTETFSPLEEEVYMKQPEGFPSRDGEKLVCKLKKSIYGLKQASRQWSVGVKFVFLFYTWMTSYLQPMIRVYFMKDMGETSYVIALRSIQISSVSPIVKDDRFNLDQCPKNDLEREQMKNIPYASAVGSLMYAQVCTRPHIAFAVGMLGRYQSNLGKDHWKAAKKVDEISSRNQRLQAYVQTTSNLEVVGYSDSDFASCVDSRKSTSGYIFILAGGAISWRSSYGFNIPLSIYCDNSVAVFMAKNNKSGSRSKHIDIKYLAIREHVKEKKVVIEHISTELMIADPLTKGMPPLKFKDHVVNMGLSSLM